MRAPGLHASDENCGQRVPAPSAPVVRLPDVPLWSHDRSEGITMTVHDHLIGDGVHAAAHALVRYAVVEPDGSERYGMTNRLSWIVRRDDRDVWRVVHEHTSLSVDEQTGNARLG